MSGEMTLRGLVLPIGGIKHKVLAAHHYGVKRVILPERNLKDLVEVPAAVLANLEILLAKRVEDVLEQAFEGGCPWRQHSKLTTLLKGFSLPLSLVILKFSFPVITFHPLYWGYK